MNVLSLSQVIIMSILVLLILIKTAHYFKKIRHRRLSNWIYFSTNSIYNSQSQETVKAKRMQNAFTIIVTILLFVTLLIELINH
jgi:uncharacterized integral membrane protein